ncbi:MBL fold metallo-hydrolase [Leifsonia sp. AG29]|uniref:MBL fold metallo-hydrolase n=1 Tax=Leifsonia sp. AG29 TaxID=2598860 RepID=UPI001E5413CA|nr:MBL fold metallo-hydrolase [Leifsonia sp. AG29]
MADWLCATCAVEFPEGEAAPASCPICEDERQYVPPSGQRWTTLQELQREGERVVVTELEPELFALRSEPRVGIGQQAMLLRTPEGNLLWDPTGYVDEAAATAVQDLGGAAIIASSHPHMFGAQTSWSRMLGDPPVLVNEADRHWVQREAPVIETWTGELEVLPRVTLRTIGGHFPGSAVVHWDRGVVLSGDTVFPGPSERWVTFQRSFPNDIPLSAAVVRRVADRVCDRPFDRMYGNLGNRLPRDARDTVLRSADRYIGWVSGDFDHLT